MGLISRLFNFTVGTAIDSEQVDAELNQILGVLNGSIDPANLSAASKNTFLKLATVADRKEAFGVYDDGASWGLTPAHFYTIPHGLGTTPSFVWVTATTGNIVGDVAGVICASLYSKDATNIVVKAQTLSGTNANFPGVQIHWRAIV